MTRVFGLLLLVVGALTTGCGGRTEGSLASPEPNGLVAYVVGSDAGTPQVRVRELGKGPPRDVTRPEQSREVEIAGWSRDGRTLKFARHLGQRGLDLFAVNVESLRQRRLAHFPVDGLLSPTGRSVAAGSESCEYDLAAGREVAAPLPLRVFDGIGKLRHSFHAVDGVVKTSTAEVAHWAPNERSLAYEVTSYSFSGDCYRNIPDSTLYDVRVDGSERRRVAAHYDLSYQVEYSGDSRRLAFLARCSYDGDVCDKILVWDGRKVTDHTPRGHVVSSSFVWSARSDALLFITTPSRGVPRFRLVASDIHTNEVRTIAPIPGSANVRPLFVEFAGRQQHGIVLFTLGRRLFAASVTGGHALWRAPWRLEPDARTPVVFLR
jgi:hypothetical protein